MDIAAAFSDILAFVEHNRALAGPIFALLAFGESLVITSYSIHYTKLYDLAGALRNPAGELVLQHIRSQVSDLARVQGQVADLSGIRRGHVSIACSQALLPYFLPSEIARYRREHAGVTFSVNVRDREQAERDLSTFSSDLALVFEPVHLVDFEVLVALPQQVNVVMAADHTRNNFV